MQIKLAHNSSLKLWIDMCSWCAGRVFQLYIFLALFWVTRRLGRRMGGIAHIESGLWWWGLTTEDAHVEKLWLCWVSQVRGPGSRGTSGERQAKEGVFVVAETEKGKEFGDLASV